MMVPYINRPPRIDITIADIWMAPLCARRAGRAIICIETNTFSVSRCFAYSQVVIGVKAEGG